MSIASMTVASSRGTLTVACGRATPTISAASASSRSAIGTWRRRPGGAATRFGRSAGVDEARAERSRRRSCQTYSATQQRDDERARAARAATRSSPAPPQEARRACAASRRTSRARRGGTPSARRARGATPLRSLGGGSAKRSRSFALRVSTRSWRPVSGSTSQSSPTFGSSCSRGSRISTASTSCRPASCEQRLAPVERAAEVGDDDDERALPRDAPVAAQARRRATSRRRLRRSGSSRSAASRPSRPARPWRAAASRGVASPNVDDAEPVAAPRRDVRRRRSRRPRRRPPCAGRPCRTASTATCRARARSTSTRSARLTRTCGSPVRAVTFQSIFRTSSPGTYGRTCASSCRRRAATSGSRPRAGPRRGGRSSIVERAQEVEPAAAPGPGASGVGAPRSGELFTPALAAARSTCGTGPRRARASRILSGVTSSASAW